MRLIATIVLFCVAIAAQAQVNNIYGTFGTSYTVGPPTVVPGARGAMVAIDTITFDWWVSTGRAGATWVKMGDRIQKRTGCIAPIGAPAKYESSIVLNSCAVPELYEWSGTAWVCITCASGSATNLSWSQISSALYRLNSSTGNDVLFKAGSNQTLSLSGDTLQIASTGGCAGTVTTDATLEGNGSALDPLKIANQGAQEGQVLAHTGATWEPSWGNPYVFVTSGATITTASNEVLIGTVSADVVFGLPNCSATHDGKHFKFVRNGTDNFSVTIDPNGAQEFYDGTTVKILYGKISIDCTCRHDGGAGKWFFDNN